jgi:hypothetical protein
MEPTAATRPAVAPARENAVPENNVAEQETVGENVGERETIGDDDTREDGFEAVVSPTAWRTFTTAPPRFAVEP